MARPWCSTTSGRVPVHRPEPRGDDALGAEPDEESGGFRKGLADFLGRTATGPVYGLEVRDRDWLIAKHFEAVAHHGPVSALLLGSWLPQIGEAHR